MYKLPSNAIKIATIEFLCFGVSILICYATKVEVFSQFLFVSAHVHSDPYISILTQKVFSWG